MNTPESVMKEINARAEEASGEIYGILKDHYNAQSIMVPSFLHNSILVIIRRSLLNQSIHDAHTTSKKCLANKA